MPSVPHSVMVRDLLAIKLGYERISVLIADSLGLPNGPVVESIRRWYLGTAMPSGPWVKGLEQVWQDKIGNVIE